jgi:hypothetical protein
MICKRMSSPVRFTNDEEKNTRRWTETGYITMWGDPRAALGARRNPDTGAQVAPRLIYN